MHLFILTDSSRLSKLFWGIRTTTKLFKARSERVIRAGRQFARGAQFALETCDKAKPRAIRPFTVKLHYYVLSILI